MERSAQSKLTSGLDLQSWNVTGAGWYLHFHSHQHWSLHCSFLTLKFLILSTFFSSVFPKWRACMPIKYICFCLYKDNCPVRLMKRLKWTFLSLDLRLAALIVANSHTAKYWWHADFYDFWGSWAMQRTKECWVSHRPFPYRGFSTLGTELLLAKCRGTGIEWKSV